eukprot:scaffold5302_cov156-Amphora_coffeaeformis.AAC.1
MDNNNNHGVMTVPPAAVGRKGTLSRLTTSSRKVVSYRTVEKELKMQATVEHGSCGSLFCVTFSVEVRRLRIDS